MKYCNQCDSNKTLEEFPWRDKGKGKRQSYCKTCQKEKSRAHYQGNRESYYKRNSHRRESMKDIIRKAKEGKPCCDCGKSFPERAMDFHHEGDKIEMVSAYHKLGSVDKLLEEIDRCVLLCAVCHRLRH